MQPSPGLLARGIGKIVALVSLADHCTCEGIDANYQPINRTSTFYNRTVYAWDYWSGSMHAGDVLTHKWYRNEKLNTTKDRWILKGEGSVTLPGDYPYGCYWYTYWDYPCTAIGLWKVERYYNGVKYGEDIFVAVIKNTDTVRCLTNVKNTGGSDHTFYVDFHVWGPSYDEHWGTTEETSVYIPKGQTAKNVMAFFANPYIRTGAYINITARVKAESGGAILAESILYSCIYVIK